MIVPMQRITLFCVTSGREQALTVLRNLGVMHLVPLRVAEARELEEVRLQIAQARRVMEVLPVKPGQPISGQSGTVVIERATRLLQEKRELETSLDELRQEHRRIGPYGDFEPDALRELQSKGVVVKLVQTPPRKTPSVPSGVVVQLLGQDSSSAYFALIGRADYSTDAMELRLPEASKTEVERRIMDIEAKLLANGDALWAHAGDHAVVLAEVQALEARLDFLLAREGMGHSSAVAYVRGFVPSESVPALKEAGAREGWGLLVEEPSTDETPPTLVRNPGWVRPISVVFKAIGILPGYQEIDISACFLLFLSLFFAILVGDAGYGLLFIGLTAWARHKFPRAPVQPFRLLYIMGVATVVWGLITGTFMGLGQTPGWLKPLKVDWLSEEQNLMRLCFLIGSVHLTVAHLWNALRSWKTLSALAQLGWIGTTWTMFFTARMMVLGESFPSFMLPVFLASVTFIILFMTPVKNLKSEWFNHVMLPLNLVSNFVDVVSYLRLFAVGSAGFAVANAFNEMALAGGWKGLGAGLVSAFILFFGHALNILLSAMGVLVHGVRLNTLEFSSHLGVQWSGIPYRPFARLAADSSHH